ncbi:MULTISPECIES: helix-turn-helix domain-containing protein [unclassified Diaminobutyricimonas]|uniref:ArsR/SmtB family transcription factor n=1 Tax=unclassified Diaminobutyricimonas TaxID=2643261 RepID=UPI0012F4879D|nr:MULTISPECIES: helix-turn-helix domain-containing protein [unclassified Diaminobutyricimonas]
MAKQERTDRVIDLEGLKALAHPLRVKIVDTLSTYGSFTASGLAERLGESSGATSYHLRQLEKHGFVREVEGKGTGRERWWERPPGGLQLTSREVASTPAGKAATRIVLREWSVGRERMLQDFLDLGMDELSPEWQDAGTVSTSNLVLTVEQLRELRDRTTAVIDEFVDRYRGQSVPGSRPVQVHFNAFPVIDAPENTAS